jgi:hypothetical protein
MHSRLVTTDKRMTAEPGKKAGKSSPGIGRTFLGYRMTAEAAFVLLTPVSQGQNTPQELLHHRE